MRSNISVDSEHTLRVSAAIHMEWYVIFLTQSYERFIFLLTGDNGRTEAAELVATPAGHRWFYSWIFYYL